jgi:hypothetical protein
MSNHRVRLFSTAFKEDVVRRLESGEALAARFRRNWGLPGSYCMNGVGRGVAMAQPV